MNHQNAVRLVASAALRNSGSLPVAERADLLDAIAQLVEADAADQARLIAFQLREAERCQLTFLTKLEGDNAP